MLQAVDITNFFKRQQRNHALLDEWRNTHGIKRGLVEAAPTRFCYVFNVLDSLIAVKPALQSAVVAAAFNSGSGTSSKDRAAVVKQTVLSDAWWSRVATIASVLKPIANAITLVQADSCTQADAYYIWRAMAADVKAAVDAAEPDDELEPELETVLEALLQRFNYGLSDMMILSAMLHPKYRWGLK